MAEFVVYELADPETFQTFYVGKGKLGRKYKDGSTQVDLAREYSLGQSTISRITLNQAYAIREAT